MLEPKKVKFRRVHRGNRRGMAMRGNHVAFGTFGLKDRNARKSRNPRTGEVVFVESKTVPYFRMGKELKDRINKQK